MKKNLFYAGTMACAMSLLASCNNEDLNSFQQNDGFRVTAGMDVQSRTAVEDELNNEGEYDIVWSAGDGIYLYGGKSYSMMTLVEGSGTSEASFSGRIYGYASDFKHAIYPVPAVNADGTFGLELAAEKDWSDNSGAPMFGNYDGGHVSFNLLTAMFRVNVDVEAGETLTLTMTDESGEAAVIAGNATITADGQFGMDAEGETAVSVTFAKAGNYMLDIPVPVGQYAGYKVMNGDVVIAETTFAAPTSLSAGDIAVASSSQAPEVEEEATEIVIMNAAELRWFAEQLNSGNTFRNKTVTLGADIDLKEIPWTPAGNGGKGAVSFRGVFDGADHSISNVAIDCDSNLDGFFGAVWGATIKNLTLDNVSGVERGLLVAKVNGTESDNQTTTIEKVTVNGSSDFKLVGTINDDALVLIDGAYYVDDNDLLNKVLTISNDILMGSGEYTMPNSAVLKNKTLNLSGTKDVIINMVSTDQNTSGAYLTFEGVTIKWGTENYEGLQHTAEVTYRNCDIEGLQFLFAPIVKFKYCNLNSGNAEHSVWTYGSNDVEFTECNFTYSDRAVNCYADSGKPTTEATFTGCTFTKVAGKETTGAIETNSSLMTGLTLNINNCTVNEGDLWWVSTWDEKNGANTVTFVDGNRVASTQAQLAAAIEAGVAEIYVSGEMKMPSSSSSNIVKIIGDGTAKIDVTWGAYLEDANLTFEKVNIKTSTGYVTSDGSKYGSDYAALYSKNVTYNKCSFSGPMRIGRDGATFNTCTFGNLGNDYVWTYGNDATFNGCTFNTDGKAILIYSDGGSEVSEVSVTGCTFNATKGAKAGAIANQNCAAIEIHNYGNGVALKTLGNKFDSNFSGEWRIKTYENGKQKVIVNDKEYTTIAIDGKAMTINADKNVTVNE